MMTPGERHQNALHRVSEFQLRVDQQVAMRRDPQWEDIADNRYQRLSIPLHLKHFRTIPIRADTVKPSPFTFA